MGNAERVLELLKRMAHDRQGQMVWSSTSAEIEENDRATGRLMEQLQTAGLARRAGPESMEITRDGYNALRGVQEGRQYMDVFTKTIDQGRHVAKAVKVLETLRASSSSG